jgi:hypothetical protein
MRSTFLPITVVLLAGATLAACGCAKEAHTGRAVVLVSAPPVAPPERRTVKVVEGRIKDVRPVWGILLLTTGKGKEARDTRFDISEARIVGPVGDEWKGQDLQVGDRVRLELTADGRLVQQVSVLVGKASGLDRWGR